MAQRGVERRTFLGAIASHAEAIAAPLARSSTLVAPLLAVTSRLLMV